MTDFLKDVQYGFRMLAQSPGFTLVAVVSLALGIGFNTAIFSAVDAVLLRPEAGYESEALVELYLSDASGYPYAASSYPDYEEYRKQTDVFSDVVGVRTALVHYREREGSEYLMGEVVSGNFFQALGMTSARGRTLEPADDVTPGGHPVVVISDAFWRTRLGSDPDVLQKTLDFNGRPYSIVGVLPSEFTGTFPGLQMQFWAPAAMVDHLNPSTGLDVSRLERRTSRGLLVKARLKEGMTIEGAQARMDVLVTELQESYPDAYRDRSIHLLPSSEVRLHPFIDGALSPVAGVLMGVVGLVLLIACANVANMLLARASARRGEVALRLALGSTRFRLVRQLLTESLILSGLGGSLGLVIAYWSTQTLLALRPPIPVPLALDLTLSSRVLLFTFAVSLATGLLFGLAPALQASRASLIPALKAEPESDGSARKRFGLRQALVVLQVSVSLLLLIGAGLMLRSVGRAQGIDPGFETEDVAILSTHLGLHGYDEERGRLFFERAIGRVAALPDVEVAALSDIVPLGASVQTRRMAPEGSGPDRDADWPEVDVATISTGYFETMGIPLIRGRDFAPTDTEESPGVMILNETAARRFWLGENPIGERITTGSSASTRELWEVIAVARDTKVRTLGEDPRPQAYFAAGQDYSPALYFLARSRGDAHGALESMRRELLAMDGSLAFFETKTMPQNLAITLYPVRMGALLLGLFGALALVLAAVGLYGVISYSVSRRTRELGIRIAIGASDRDILTMIARQGLALVLVGAALGLCGAAAGTRVLANVLYGVSATDVVTFAGTTLVLMAVALVANWIPARRASKVSPVTALRYE